MTNLTKRNLLKSAHILFSAIWLGSVFSMMLISTVRYIDADKTLQLIFLIKLIDIFVAISAVLTLVSGLLIAWLGGWGFKSLWVRIKIYLNIGIILLGLGAVIHWEKTISILNLPHVSVTQSATYLFQVLQLNMVAVILLVTAFIISVFKPRKKNQRLI